MGGAASKSNADALASMLETLELTPLLAGIDRREALAKICPLFKRVTIEAGASIYGPKLASQDDLCVVESGNLKFVVKKGGEDNELHTCRSRAGPISARRE